jgi:hypothetical protein
VSAGGLSKTALRDLQSLDRRDDRLWRMGYAADLADARRPRRRRSWPLWWLLLPVTAVLALCISTSYSSDSAPS